VLAFVTILVWLWTGTAMIPEKDEKPVGLGLTLPLYASGQLSVGWWAMLITMLGDLTAFVSLVFGYFFYWSLRPGFILEGSEPGWFWPVIALAATLAAWLLTVGARQINRRDRPGAFYGMLALAAALAAGAAVAMVSGVMQLHPQRHVYDAIVWTLVIWVVLHLGLGIVMHLYCTARRAAGRMTHRHDIDITNTALYWHFVAAQMAITVAVTAGFPVAA
jgi:cytochrome c oxidase subunit I+III